MKTKFNRRVAKLATAPGPIDVSAGITSLAGSSPAAPATNRRTFPPRTCPTCGVTFTPDTHTQRYCIPGHQPKRKVDPKVVARYRERVRRSRVGKYAGL